MSSCPWHQRDRFSQAGLSKGVVDKLQSQYSICIVDSGHIRVVALNNQSIDRVAKAIAAWVQD